ncbi:MAG: hypothetical protein QGH15_08190 [Kiritimatiellia bacterium]|jgi:hypothetical protein|nr:hypothetical protein [Kiritimatiellia bacterium]
MTKVIRNSAILVALSACSIILCGCDDGSSPSGNDFRIEPSRVTLSLTEETVTLTVIGGLEPLTWAVTTNALGTVSGSGRTVTYTRTDLTGANHVEVTDNQTWTATAIITQMGEEEEEEEDEPLTVSPTSATLDYDGDQVVFTASGGIEPYSWEVGDSSLGTVSWDASSTAIYTRNTTGENTVVVYDHEGHAALAEVNQP